jgi:hypothetical protein
MEAVYYAARANLRRLMIQHPRLPTRPIGPGNRHVKKLGRVTGKNACEMCPSMMSRCCKDPPVPLIIRFLDSTLQWSIGC